MSEVPNLRISAGYHAGQAGDAIPAGQPETVEITLNEGLPADPAHLAAFITTLLDSLFRAEGHSRTDTHVHLYGSTLDTDQVRGLSLVDAEQAR